MDTMDIKILNLRLERILMEAGFHVKRVGRQFHQFEHNQTTITIPVANYDLERHYIKIDHNDRPNESDTFSFDINEENEMSEQAVQFLEFHAYTEQINAL